MPSFEYRERTLAHNIMRAVTENPGQDAFVAYVGREHLMQVTKHLIIITKF